PATRSSPPSTTPVIANGFPPRGGGPGKVKKQKAKGKKAECNTRGVGHLSGYVSSPRDVYLARRTITGTSIHILPEETNPREANMNIAVLGTGIVGRTIGDKLMQIGHQVTMGSRTADNPKAAEWAAA